MTHETILVTPEGAPVIADGTAQTIQFPPLTQWETADAALARSRGKDRIAPPDFELLIGSVWQGRRVNLAKNGQIRLGCGIGLVVNGKPVLRLCNATHPTRPWHLTPVAGLFEGGTPLETASNELCEEFIVRSTREVGGWCVSGHSFMERAVEYAAWKNLTVASHRIFEVTLTVSRLHWTVLLGQTSYRTLVAFEPDTSSIELLFTGSVTLPSGWYIADGEQFPPGVWLGERIVRSGFHRYQPTTKAAIFLAAHREGLSK